MTRFLFGCLVALSIGFVSGCSGSGETEVIDVPDMTEAEMLAEEEAYEAEMEASNGEGDG